MDIPRISCTLYYICKPISSIYLRLTKNEMKKFQYRSGNRPNITWKDNQETVMGKGNAHREKKL